MNELWLGRVTVKELIEHLSKVDQDLNVCVYSNMHEGKEDELEFYINDGNLLIK